MNKNSIAETVSKIIENINTLGGLINKGKATEITIGMEKGFATVEVGSKFSIFAFVDNDGKSQIALLSRTIKNLL
jgi:predicted RNA-binding protein (virulence factor B family)